MSIYRYPESAVIDEVTFRKTANGGLRAYAHMREEVNGNTADSLKMRLREADFDWVPFTLGGKPTLEIRGFKKEAQLLEVLNRHGGVLGNPTIFREAGDRIGWKELFHKNTLFLSGLSMAIADIGFSIYGIKEAKIHKLVDPNHRRDFSEALAGLSYLSGSTVLSLYGRNDQSDIQVREMAELILQAARERGLVTEKSAAESLGEVRKESVFTRVNNFFREYPAEISNMAYFSAGTLIAQSALRNRALAKPRPGMTAKQIHEMRKGGWGDTLLGASTMASGLLATFGKERHHDPDAPDKHGVTRIADWIQSNPLAVASYDYIGSTLCHAYTTFIERREAIRAAGDKTLSANERFLAGEKVKSVPWRVLFIGATLVGELLMSISSKGHGQGVVSDNSVDNSAIAVAADLIVRQPKPVQDHLIEYMAAFLGRSDVLSMKNEEVTRLLRSQVEEMRKNPWAGGKGHPEKPAAPETHEKKSAAEAASWQVKALESPPAPQHVR